MCCNRLVSNEYKARKGLSNGYCAQNTALEWISDRERIPFIVLHHNHRRNVYKICNLPVQTLEPQKLAVTGMFQYF